VAEQTRDEPPHGPSLLRTSGKALPPAQRLRLMRYALTLGRQHVDHTSHGLGRECAGWHLKVGLMLTRRPMTTTASAECGPFPSTIRDFPPRTFPRGTFPGGTNACTQITIIKYHIGVRMVAAMDRTVRRAAMYSPYVRRHRLAAELRKAREDRGLSTDE